jgi:hypothetical protein
MPVPPPADALAEMEISFMDIDRDAKRKLHELGLRSLGDTSGSSYHCVGQAAVTPLPQRYNVWGLKAIDEEIDRPPQDDLLDEDL